MTSKYYPGMDIFLDEGEQAIGYKCMTFLEILTDIFDVAFILVNGNELFNHSLRNFLFNVYY